MGVELGTRSIGPPGSEKQSESQRRKAILGARA
jgi:hypothetical protein